MKQEKSQIINDYMDKYPNMSNKKLAEIIYSKYPELFSNTESIRSSIRERKGASGKKKLKELKNEKYLTPEKRAEKYNLPPAKFTPYKPYLLRGNSGLIFSDVHIPFHNVESLEIMFDYTKKMKLDFILLLGDIMDCFEISRFSHDPTICDFPKERDMTKDFLKELKKVYKDSKIIYKFGNHEKRFEDYLQRKAPELYGFKEFRLEVLLDLHGLGIEYVSEEKYLELSGLNLLHGHEYKNAITSPANPARTYYLRTKDNALGAHYHQSSEHNESNIRGDNRTCWSIGCMCDLHPKYMPLNKWVNGFAIYERFNNNFWNIQNKKIMEGQVV